MPRQPEQDEPEILRRSIRELAALSSLSAIWISYDAQAIADSLCRVLCRSLPAELTYVRLAGADDGIIVEAAATEHRGEAERRHAIGIALEPVLRAADNTAPVTIANPLGAGTVQVAVARIGLGGDLDVVAAASAQPLFPSPVHRLLLGVAANQAAIVLQQKRSQEQLRSSERELADFFDNATIGLHWVGPDGSILRVNNAELTLLGYTSDEYLGRHIADFHADRDVIDDILKRLRDGERLRDYPARMVCKDGSIKHVMIDSSVLWHDGRFVHTRCFTRDVTEQKLAEENRLRLTERLRLLWETAGVLLSADSAATMLRGLLSKIGPHLGVDSYLSYAVDEHGDGLRLTSFDGVPADIALDASRLSFSDPVFGAVARQRQPLVIERLHESSDPAIRRLSTAGIRALACHPLVAGNRLFGTLAFASRVKDHFDAEERAFIETISHYVTLAYERLELLHELKEADRRKDEFLATLAHELRNPLAPMRNAVQVLRLKGPDEPELRWGREVIVRQVEHLTRLIDDLMDISRITRNRLELRRQRIELAAVIQGAVESSRPTIEQCGHQLTVTLPAQPAHLHGDLVRLAQVFLNLLNNAAKYTEPGGRIWLTAERHGAEVVVRVKDTGVGIAPEKLPRLFDLFFQVERTLERSRGGLGIGLSLVRRLVELHGGRVEAHSDGVGQGSEFAVWLPVLVEEEAVAAGGSERPTLAESTAPARLIVADDNRDSADSLAVLLRLSGHEVETAYDGMEALDLAKRIRPDAVLLDIGMPRLNGYDTCRSLRQLPGGDAMMVIAMTGWGQEEDRRRTVDAGFDAHLVKPVAPEELERLLVGRHDRARARASAT
jgi:PAS domain S-box-containing protein